MINNVVLVGRLTKDPDLRYTASGSAVATFTLAVNRNFTNQNGDREADFINCVIWRKPAETMANYARKGTLLGVVGRNGYQSQNRSFGNNNAGSGFNNNNSFNPSSSQSQNNNGMPDFDKDSDPFGGSGSSIDISDDDLPF